MPRSRVAAMALLGVLLVGGVVWLTEVLRHPLPGGPPSDAAALDEPASDPRTPVECAEPPPREGQERDGEDVSAVRTPVEVSASALYDCPQTFAGLRVRYEGEVVGAVLRRADGAWLQLNDDVYADVLGPLPSHRDFRGGNSGVGVFVAHAVADRITHVGGPKARGDIVAVEGPFRRVDAETGEVAVIRAEEAEVVRPGELIVPPGLADRRVAAGVVATITFVLYAVERTARRRAREAGAAR